MEQGTSESDPALLVAATTLITPTGWQARKDTLCGFT